MTLVLFQNSFVTLEEAEAYFDERFDSDKWTNPDSKPEDGVKEKLLITASRKINCFDFVGKPLENDQPMAFPRDFELPQDIKDAVCEEAYSMLSKESSVHKKNQESNISSISLGAGSISYNAPVSLNEDTLLDSSTALYLIKKWVKKGFFTNYIQ